MGRRKNTTLPEAPVSIRMSQELQQQLDDCSLKLHMPVTHLMRLCMRIGMEHFKRIDYDEAKCIVETVEQKNKPSFSNIRESAAVSDPSCASSADSKSPSPFSPPTRKTTASTVPLPPPPVLGTLIHDTSLNETPVPYVVEKKRANKRQA